MTGRNRHLTAMSALLAATALAGTLAVGTAVAQEATQAPTAQAPAAQAPAALPTVGVRAGIHPTYSRLVFDWERAVPHTVERNGDRVTVRFAAPATADLRAALRVNAPLVRDLASDGAEGGMAVSFTVPAGAVLKDFRSGPRLVVDVSVPANAASAAVGPAASPPPAASETPASSQAAAGPRPAAEAEVPLYRLPGRGSGAPGAQEAARQSQAQQAQAQQSQAQPEPAPVTPPVAQAQPPAEEKPPEAPAAAAPIPLTTAAAPPPVQAPVPAAAGAGPAPAEESAAGPSAADDRPVRITFDPKQPSSAVMFERAGWFYVLFDREVDALPTGDALGGFTGTIEPVAFEGGGGYRLALPPLLVPRATRDGTAWTLSLLRSGTAAAAEEPESLEVRPDPEFALGARMIIAAEEGGAVLPFPDPVVGDVLQLVPLPVAGQLIAEPRRFREAELLPTVQGLAIRPVDDRLQVRLVREGVDMSVPGGLMLSPEEDTVAANPPPPPQAAPQALFDYARWGQTSARDFIPMRQKLTQAISDAPPEMRTRTRLDLARFFAANGFGTETQALLQLVQEGQPDVNRRAEFLAARGIARVLTGDAKGALRDLSSPGVAGDPDGDLWRATAASMSGDHALAHDLFKQQRSRLDAYPEPYFTRMAMAAVDSALDQDAVEEAALLTERMVRRNSHTGPRADHVQFRRGRVHQALGDATKAEEIFAKLAAGDDRLNRTLATRELIELRLKEGKITAKDAAEAFEKLRFAWRGDALELSNLRRLGEIHALAENYADGFETMRRTISLFPDDPQAKEIADDMTRTFAELFLKDGAAHLSPLEALSLYEQYRELTPPGREGDLIIRRLAERLVEIDLLDRAAELLDRQVQFRLAGEEKTKVGTRLAAIRLLDNRPEDALAALDKSATAGLSEELEAERRLLRARALSRMGKGAEAVKLLAADRSQPASMLRVDIAWRDKQWPAASQALADIIGPPPPVGTAIDADKARLVINRALALSLAQDTAGLALLRDQFATAMATTGEAQMFTVLTRPNEATGLLDMGTIQARVAEIDLFRSFLDSYRTRQEASAAPPSGPAVN